MTIRQLFLTSLLSSIASIDAFVAPTTHVSPVRAVVRHPTPLHAEAEEPAAEETKQVPEAELPSEDDSDILNSPAFLRRKVEVLESDLAALAKEVEEANAIYLQGKEEWGSKFDALNTESQLIQQRMTRQGDQKTDVATQDVVKQMLEVVDIYDRAFVAAPPSNDEETEIKTAYENTYNMILDAFAGLNVTKVETVGIEFDYELHQAVMQLASDEHEEGIVCQEFAPGWMCGEKLIRPAMVAVAA